MAEVIIADPRWNGQPVFLLVCNEYDNSTPGVVYHPLAQLLADALQAWAPRKLTLASDWQAVVIGASPLVSTAYDGRVHPGSKYRYTYLTTGKTGIASRTGPADSFYRFYGRRAGQVVPTTPRWLGPTFASSGKSFIGTVPSRARATPVAKSLPPARVPWPPPLKYRSPSAVLEMRMMLPYERYGELVSTLRPGGGLTDELLKSYEGELVALRIYLHSEANATRNEQDALGGDNNARSIVRNALVALELLPPVSTPVYLSQRVQVPAGQDVTQAVTHLLGTHQMLFTTLALPDADGVVVRFDAGLAHRTESFTNQSVHASNQSVYAVVPTNQPLTVLQVVSSSPRPGQTLVVVGRQGGTGATPVTTPTPPRNVPQNVPDDIGGLSSSPYANQVNEIMSVGIPQVSHQPVRFGEPLEGLSPLSLAELRAATQVVQVGLDGKPALLRFRSPDEHGGTGVRGEVKGKPMAVPYGSVGLDLQGRDGVAYVGDRPVMLETIEAVLAHYGVADRPRVLYICEALKGPDSLAVRMAKGKPGVSVTATESTVWIDARAGIALAAEATLFGEALQVTRSDKFVEIVADESGNPHTMSEASTIPANVSVDTAGGDWSHRMFRQATATVARPFLATGRRVDRLLGAYRSVTIPSGRWLRPKDGVPPGFAQVLAAMTATPGVRVIVVGAPGVGLPAYVIDQVRDLVKQAPPGTGTRLVFASPLSLDQVVWVHRRVRKSGVAALIPQGQVRSLPNVVLYATRPWVRITPTATGGLTPPTPGTSSRSRPGSRRWMRCHCRSTGRGSRPGCC